MRLFRRKSRWDRIQGTMATIVAEAMASVICPELSGQRICG
jgi:hypothetical protein